MPQYNVHKKKNFLGRLFELYLYIRIPTVITRTRHELHLCTNPALLVYSRVFTCTHMRYLQLLPTPLSKDAPIILPEHRPSETKIVYRAARDEVLLWV